jgi:hypothetical protein
MFTVNISEGIYTWRIRLLSIGVVVLLECYVSDQNHAQTLRIGILNCN